MKFDRIINILLSPKNEDDLEHPNSVYIGRDRDGVCPRFDMVLEIDDRITFNEITPAQLREWADILEKVEDKGLGILKNM